MASIIGGDSKVFERAVGAVIAANAALVVWGVVDDAHHELIERIESTILVLFGVELVLRVRRHGWRFLRQPWGVFDVAVLALALVPVLPVNASALRLARSV